ncbi:ABC-2 type transporter [Parelaphostrongylus tenuis]|uniref:ABC-2 type transporter n=1 Tax=Parelaphostrongylus tenuis TaxID=148309 RepID=A0AAD5QDM9_PARTN|nr:ABC-2 type transporter [Parelaphostrongylus tenuis]
MEREHDDGAVFKPYFALAQLCLRIEEEKTLTWLDIEATVPMTGKSKNARQKKVLQKVSGIALPREVLAIMGGSGAGKTTLMNILAFQSAKEVQALLRLGDKYTHQEKLQKVEEVIKDMNLTDCQNTLIGIPNRKKGISIGEKKRLAFGSEILTDPTILFCDEPTSGLDAYMASQVVSALQLMARKGKTIVTVIHQPGSAVFNMFHSLGKPSLRIPESYNPADHVIGCLSISKETEDDDIKRINFIAEMFDESPAGDELKEHIRYNSVERSQDDGSDDEIRKT